MSFENSVKVNGLRLVEIGCAVGIGAGVAWGILVAMPLPAFIAIIGAGVLVVMASMSRDAVVADHAARRAAAAVTRRRTRTVLPADVLEMHHRLLATAGDALRVSDQLDRHVRECMTELIALDGYVADVEFDNGSLRREITKLGLIDGILRREGPVRASGSPWTPPPLAAMEARSDPAIAQAPPRDLDGGDAARLAALEAEITAQQAAPTA